MQSSDLEESTAFMEPSGIQVNEEVTMLDRLKNCGRKCDDLRAQLRHALEINGKKFDELIAKPLEGLKPLGHVPHVRVADRDRCASTPLVPAPTRAARPESGSSVPEEMQVERMTANRFALFGDEYSEDHYYDFEWTTEDDDDKPDDDFEGRPIGRLDPNILKNILSKPNLVLPKVDPTVIDADWNGPDKDSDSISTEPLSRVTGADVAEEPNWVDRMKDCNLRITDLRAKFRDSLIVQAKKRDQFIREALELRKFAEAPSRKKITIQASSTPINAGLAKPMRQEFDAGSFFEDGPYRPTPNRVVLFSDDMSKNADYHHDFEWTTEEGDNEPDDDFGGRPIGRLDPNILRNLLRVVPSESKPVPVVSEESAMGLTS